MQENNQINKNTILKVFYDILKNVSRDNASRFMRNHFAEHYDELMRLTNSLDKFDIRHDKTTKISIFERIYCIEHGLTDRPKCANCGENYVCKFNKQKNEYSRWCSAKCQASDKSCIEKSKLTRLEKYGVENYNGIDKAKETRLEKYGGWHDPDFVEKMKQTKTDHYGDPNFVNPEKAKTTKLELYGSATYVNAEKIRQTKKEKYGDENFNNRPKFLKTLNSFTEDRKLDIKRKRKNTCRSIYGVDFPTQNEAVLEKTKRTCLEKYGTTSTLNTEMAKTKSAERIKEKSWQMIISDTEYEPCFSKEEYISNRQHDMQWTWKCKKCGNMFQSAYDNGHHRLCTTCFPNIGCSILETELREFITRICGCNVISHDRRTLKSGKELDIVIPERKIAFEFDGLYFHSDANGKNRNYHVDKTNECADLGIRLIHVFEDEWRYKNKIVKTKIRHILGGIRRKIFARKCEIQEIDSKTKNMFLEKYHIQGKDRSIFSYGLTYRNRLVAVMTFCKSRFSKKHEYELSRYATVSNFKIVGGAGKLLRHFEKNVRPKSLITYADRRWSVGNLYFTLGFQHAHDSVPNYFYTKGACRFSRIKFQKHKLKEKLRVFDPSKTEVENMRANGYFRIFDCGNMVFEKTY